MHGQKKKATQQLVVPKRKPAPPIKITPLQRALEVAVDPAEIKDINAQADAFEQYMHDSGLYSIEDMRPVNELRMRARWKLGAALRAVEREPEGRPAKTTKLVSSFWRWAKETLGLEPPTVVEAQRISAMPEGELLSACAEAAKQARLLFYRELVERARPHWYKASREAKHREIRTAATAKAIPDSFGPFPLIYADPPWAFEIYSEKGLERTPDQHYPTLSPQEIKDFRIGKLKLTIPEIAHRDAALLLWCTSSNLPLALEVMAAWDFTFKSSAVWVKDKSGLGLVFRNQHELLLYGTRGNMPGPQYQPRSVFPYPRGRHSAKPPEIRAEIEKMYPDFDASSRLELFARDQSQGWTVYGYES